MTTVYAAHVTGDGLSPATAFRPAGFDGLRWVILMLDQNRSRCLLVSSSDTVTGPNVVSLVTGASWSALLSWARATSPPAHERNVLGTWISSAGLTALTSSQVNWFDCLTYVARQVNPAADLSATDI